MPRNRPNIGDTNWGTTLNNHLKQISPAGGGINYGTTAQRPTLTSDDNGYTYFDTTTKQVIRWNGNSWEVVLTGLINDSQFISTINVNGNQTPEINFTGNMVESVTFDGDVANVVLRDRQTPPPPPLYVFDSVANDAIIYYFQPITTNWERYCFVVQRSNLPTLIPMPWPGPNGIIVSWTIGGYSTPVDAFVSIDGAPRVTNGQPIPRFILGINTGAEPPVGFITLPFTITVRPD